MKKKLLAILLCLCMVMSLAPAALAAGSAPFTDVAADAWYADEVQWVYDQSLMDGVGNGNFAPATTTTRGMLVTILWRLEGEPEPAAANPFTDMADGQWYTEAVIWAAENKIVEGYGANLFGPADDITREQLATILYRYAQYKEYDVSVGENTNILSYVDAFDISEWAIPAMQWACGAGLISGVTEDALAPQSAASRAQLAVVLYRLNENVIEPEEEEPVTPPAPPVIIPPTPDCTDTYESNGDSTHDVTCSDGTHTAENVPCVFENNVCVCGFEPAAMIGTKGYATAQAAIDAAQNGETITLLDVDGGHGDLDLSHLRETGVTIIGETLTEGKVEVGRFFTQAPDPVSKIVGLTVENIAFPGVTAGGFHFEGVGTGSENLTIKNCTFTGKAHINLGDGRDHVNTQILDCVFTDIDDGTDSATTALSGILAYRIDGMTIKGCTFTNMDYNAIQLFNRNDSQLKGDVLIEGNTINGTGDRVFRFGPITAEGTLTIKNNTITSNGDGDGQLAKATSLADGSSVTLSGNKWNSGTANDVEVADKLINLTYTAKVGTKGYATLQAAIDAAPAGSTVELLKSITVTEQIDVDQFRAMTIDGNGYTITASGTWSAESYSKHLLSVVSNNVTVTDLTLDCGDSAVNAWGLVVWQCTGVALNDVTVSNVSDSTPYAGLTINGAAVTAENLSVDKGKYGSINLDAKGYTENPTSLTVTGTIAEAGIWSDPTNTLGTANGQVSVSIANYKAVDARPGAYLWVTDVSAAEAKIGDVYYATLKDALAAATSGQTVTLLKSVTGTTTMTDAKVEDGNIPVAYILPVGVTLDGNNKTLTVAGQTGQGNQWTTYATPILMLGSGTVKNLTIDCATRGIVCYKNSDNVVVTIDHVTIENSHRPINVTGNNTNYTVTVSNSTLGGRSSFSVTSLTFETCTFNDGASISSPNGVEPTLTNCTYLGAGDLPVDLS